MDVRIGAVVSWPARRRKFILAQSITELFLTLSLDVPTPGFVLIHCYNTVVNSEQWPTLPGIYLFAMTFMKLRTERNIQTVEARLPLRIRVKTKVNCLKINDRRIIVAWKIFNVHLSTCLCVYSHSSILYATVKFSRHTIWVSYSLLSSFFLVLLFCRLVDMFTNDLMNDCSFNHLIVQGTVENTASSTSTSVLRFRVRTRGSASMVLLATAATAPVATQVITLAEQHHVSLTNEEYRRRPGIQTLWDHISSFTLNRVNTSSPNWILWELALQGHGSICTWVCSVGSCSPEVFMSIQLSCWFR